MIDLTGQRFARLVVLREDGRMGPAVAWLCQCDCGQRKRVRSDHLRQSRVRSCGCFQLETRTTHGMTGSPEYEAWVSMWQRTRNANHPAAHRYVGRGITVADEWRSFEAFFAELGPRPSSKHSLDRIDNSLGYQPGNCRWTTQVEQLRNSDGRPPGENPCRGVGRFRKKYRAYIGVDNRTRHLGLFFTIEEARKAYETAARELGFSESIMEMQRP